MKNKSKSNIILSLYNSGNSASEIEYKTRFKRSTINGTIRNYLKNKNKEGFFNVNEKDCWLIPTSDPRTHE